MFKPNVFGCLPSSGLKKMTVHTYIYILYNSRWEKFGDINDIGETVRNLAVRIAEHSNPAHTSEPAKHLREKPSHSFTWRVLSSAQTFHKRRIVEGLMIQQFRPSLNKQVISYVIQTFPIGNYIRYICTCGRSPFLTLMMANSRKRLVFTF